MTFYYNGRMHTRRELLPLLCSLTAASKAQTFRYDMIIKGGRVIDPSQSVSAPRDVAIAGNKIARVDADIPASEGRLTLDARGKAKILSGEKRPFRAYGPTCDSADVLPRPVPLPNAVATGDYVLFDAMGAYTVSSRSSFNGYYPDSWVVIG